MKHPQAVETYNSSMSHRSDRPSTALEFYETGKSGSVHSSGVYLLAGRSR
jgi:hypothetical protein